MGKARNIPQGSRFGNYFIVTEKIEGEEKLRIRRRVILPCGTKIEPRYPASRYCGIHSRDQLEKLVNKLNYRENQKAKRNIEIRTSFIPTDIMESFRDRLQIDIPSEKDFRYLYNTVFKKYFLGFFINKKIYDPKEFSRFQEQWAKALLGKADNPEENIFDNASVKSIKRTIDIANRFMAHLKEKCPDDYPTLIVFAPLGKGALKEHAASQSLADEDTNTGQYISNEHWKTIEEALPESISAPVRLAYLYGLRRSESLGFESTKAVKVGHLTISKQIKAFKDGQAVYKSLKDKDRVLLNQRGNRSFKLMKFSSSIYYSIPSTKCKHS